jgi:hypothetical protein
MLSKDPTYRLVKVASYGGLGTASYWLGLDHLLVVVMSGYVESYHRFLFSDIQAVVIRKSRLHYVWGFGSAFFAIMCVLSALATASPGTLRNDTGTAVWFGVLMALAGVFCAGVLVNWLRGPSCVCHLRTAVQTMPLPHITRWRKAQTLVAELTPLVIAAQGGGKGAAQTASAQGGEQAEIEQPPPPAGTEPDRAQMGGTPALG